MGIIRRANILVLALNDHLEWTFHYHLAGDPLSLRGARTLKDFRSMIYGLCPETRDDEGPSGCGYGLVQKIRWVL
jgi:hypothetical protein